jgi:peptidoglycan pentaglycine glycine transferase (the first glycine)
MPVLSADQWHTYLSEHPEAHILQSEAWGALKNEFGWSPAWLETNGSGVQVLFRRLPLGFHVGYIPKGPVGEDWTGLWSEVDRLCRQNRAIFLRVEPDAWEPAGSQMERNLPGFQPCLPVQPRRTILISLEGTEEDWLARMKQKTRYNIRLAERKGVVVKPSRDLEAFSALMSVTGQRDGFGVHSQAYYRRAFDLFYPRGECELLSAEFEGRVLAMLMVFARGGRSWYLYGASSDEERNRMPTYLLQWETMRWAARHGCQEYDLWGIPDADEDTLENEFTSRSDGLWGVYRYKRGFGGELKRSVGGWQKIYIPALYKVYQAWLRRRGGGDAG